MCPNKLMIFLYALSLFLGNSNIIIIIIIVLFFGIQKAEAIVLFGFVGV